eukprot:SM000107S14096  [mRNA]  locus=s107:273902:275706:- [translate_table: standard]
MATGLLVVCLGKATKLADRYQAMVKVYSGTFRLGEATPSLDADTEISETREWRHVEDVDLQGVKEHFLGDTLQVPPMYSAIHMKGERLYEKARRGEVLELQPRPVSIRSIDLERNAQSRQDIDFRMVCSKGTYVRSLVRDLGHAVNSCAHLIALRREQIGELSAEDSFTMPDILKYLS